MATCTWVPAGPLDVDVPVASRMFPVATRMFPVAMIGDCPSGPEGLSHVAGRWRGIAVL